MRDVSLLVFIPLARDHLFIVNKYSMIALRHVVYYGLL